MEAAVAMAAVAAEHSVKIANNALGFVGCTGFGTGLCKAGCTQGSWVFVGAQQCSSAPFVTA